MVIYLGSYGTQIVTWPSQAVYPCPAPAFLATHPHLPVFYAVSEAEGGAVTAFRIGSEEGHTVATGGSSPCHLAVHPAGDRLAVANYAGGSVSLISLDEHGMPTGSPMLHQFSGSGPDPERQEAPHAHFVQFAGDELLVVDLGSDRIHRLDLDGKVLGGIEFPAGSGPRHLAFGHGDHRFVAFELDGTIGGYRATGDGTWREANRVPASRTGVTNFPSHIATSAAGDLVYIANRGPDTISAFAVAADASLTMVDEVPTGGQWPRHFAIDGDQLYVANQNSANVARFRLDDQGIPRHEGDLCQIDSPSCVLPATT